MWRSCIKGSAACFNTSHGVHHKVLATDKAEDCYVVAVVNDSQCSEYFVKCRSAGGDVVYDQYVLVVYVCPQLSVLLAPECEE